MDNRCFVIMPPSEPAGYPQGHFNRVYDYVIIPACRAAGLWPNRADQFTADSPMTLVRNIIDCAAVVCDLSAGNTDALYALSIRSALNLPVTPVKDMKTFVGFDVNEFGTVEYDDSLRIDTVQKAIEELGEALKKSVEGKKDRHALLTRMGIGIAAPAPAPVEDAAPAPTPKPEPHPLPLITPMPDYVGDAFSEVQIEKLKAGDELFHRVHGRGKLNSVKKGDKERLANIQFESGPKLLVLVASDFFRKVNG